MRERLDSHQDSGGRGGNVSILRGDVFSFVFSCSDDRAAFSDVLLPPSGALCNCRQVKQWTKYFCPNFKY